MFVMSPRSLALGLRCSSCRSFRAPQTPSRESAFAFAMDIRRPYTSCFLQRVPGGRMPSMTMSMSCLIDSKVFVGSAHHRDGVDTRTFSSKGQKRGRGLQAWGTWSGRTSCGKRYLARRETTNARSCSSFSDNSALSGYRQRHRRDHHGQLLRYMRSGTLKAQSGDERESGREDLAADKEGAHAEDTLLASLANELVWKGGEDDNDDNDQDDLDEAEERQGEGHGQGVQEDWRELDTLDLERLGITMEDDENSDEVQRELKRERGQVVVENVQKEYEVDVVKLEKKLRQAMEVLGCQAWDVGVVLTTDKEVYQLNAQYRGMKASTDILSFPMNDMSDDPGVLPQVRFPAEMDLGDMFISLAYVERQIKRDEEEAEAFLGAGPKDGGDRRGRDGDVSTAEDQDWWDKERGVSGAMSSVFDVEERASMLLVHGLIHLLGYDHETEEDYLAMVQLEEKILKAVFDYKQ